MQSIPADVASPNWSIRATAFDRLAGWAEDDHGSALSCFRISARRMAERPYSRKAFGVDPLELAEIGRRALRLSPSQCANAKTAKQFFEENFRPFAIAPADGGGFLTGYFEPEMPASPVRTAKFVYPLYRRPPDLVEITDANRPQGWNRELGFGRRLDDRIVEYFDRAAIEAGALAGRGLELAFIESAIDGFFIHIQGSARLLMPAGRTTRISFAGKSGHAYTAIGRVLIEDAQLRRETVTMQAIRDWLAAHPDRAAAIMAQNQSFIFFAETDAPDPALGPIAAASVQLSPGRSLAVDRDIHTFGTPIFVSTRGPLSGDAKPLRRLAIAQDIGSAIVGVARGDLFVGSGLVAGEIAGAIRHAAEFHVLFPAIGDSARDGNREG